MLPVLVPVLRRDGELVITDARAALLMAMSAATIDRRLASARSAMILRSRSHTKPGSLLKSQIPVRTCADRDAAVPGFEEIELVGHDGGNAAGGSIRRMAASSSTSTCCADALSRRTCLPGPGPGTRTMAPTWSRRARPASVSWSANTATTRPPNRTC